MSADINSQTTTLPHPLEPLIKKLSNHGSLTYEAKSRLSEVASRYWKEDRGNALVTSDRRHNGTIIVLEGIACRYRILSSGSRQITAWLLPGDSCEHDGSPCDPRDDAVATMTSCRLAFIDFNVMEKLLHEHESVRTTFRSAALAAEAIYREWIVNLGRRNAKQRIAHLLCEMYYRYAAIDQLRDGEFDLQVTQNDVADTVGLTIVSVSRSMSELREAGCIEQGHRRVQIVDAKRLGSIADFSPTYLRTNVLPK